MNECDYIVGKLEEKLTTLRKVVSDGKCPNFEEYKYVCGQIRGLEAACGTIMDLKNQAEKSDD